MDPVQMIRIRRSGERAHTAEELQWFVKDYTAGNIPEYQMAAWLMASCFQPLSATETAILTKAMVDSTPGGPLQWPQDGGAVLVDKHSTGGVGDKVSLILAPLVATFHNVKVPMIAGRGLGHTGGTIDKLESIPGFNTRLSMREFQDIVNGDVGCCIAAAGPELCPADQKLYALRDVTSTVQNIGLQTASILCKKIAEHPKSLLLDVKYGSGAFQSTVEQAAELATSMVFTGDSNGLSPTIALLTRMHQPLGYAIGNWYEVQECLELLQGHWDTTTATATKLSDLSYDLIALVCIQAGQMLLQSGVYPGKSLNDLTQLAYDTLYEGKALPKFIEMALRQGADPNSVDRLWYPDQEQMYEPVVVRAGSSGRIMAMDTMQLGWIAASLGAGRRKVDDVIDPYAGILLRCKIGSMVQAGHVLMELYYNHARAATTAKKIIDQEDLVQQAAACVTIQEGDASSPTKEEAFALEPVVSHIVTVSDGVQEFGTTNHPLPTLIQTLYRNATNRCNTTANQ